MLNFIVTPFENSYLIVYYLSPTPLPLELKMHKIRDLVRLVSNSISSSWQIIYLYKKYQPPNISWEDTDESECLTQWQLAYIGPKILNLHPKRIFAITKSGDSWVQIHPSPRCWRLQYKFTFLEMDDQLHAFYREDSTNPETQCHPS